MVFKDFSEQEKRKESRCRLVNSKGKSFDTRQCPQLATDQAWQRHPKPLLSSARVAPNPSQTTPNNPRNFFQASDPGARLGADIPFLQTTRAPRCWILLFGGCIGQTQGCPGVGEGGG